MSRIEQIAGRAIPLRGDDIDTDRIMPARFLKSITFDGLEEHLFEDERRTSTRHPLDDSRYAGATILVVGRNFGCGSSREHAPQAIYRRGVRAIVGESYSEIFSGNATALGLPCVTVERDATISLLDAIESDPTQTITVDLAALQVRAGGLVVAASLPPSVRDAFLSGGWDATGLLLENAEEIDATAGRLPYLAW